MRISIGEFPNTLTSMAKYIKLKIGPISEALN